MKTEVYDISEGPIRRAAEVIRGGGLVVFPTETVYGIGADAFNEEAVRRVYEAKGRPSDNPMIVHIARASDISLLSDSLPPEFVKLADAFWPGPLTMVVKKRPEVPDIVTGGLDTVGVRLPDSDIARELISLAGTPVAAPSANLSGGPSPTKAGHVIADMDGKADVILAGPDCRVGIESTVIDMTVTPPVTLRPGVVTREDLEAVLEAPVDGGFDADASRGSLREALDFGAAAVKAGQSSLSETSAWSLNESSENFVRSQDSRYFAPLAEIAEFAPHSLREECQNSARSAQRRFGLPVTDAAVAPRSPGMKYRHYAPRARMVVVEGAREKVRAELERLKGLNEGMGVKVGLLLFEERSYIEAAHDFYAELRALDDEGVDLIIAGALPETDGVGFAVMNRMMKAAGYNVVRV